MRRGGTFHRAPLATPAPWGSALAPVSLAVEADALINCPMWASCLSRAALPASDDEGGGDPLLNCVT